MSNVISRVVGKIKNFLLFPNHYQVANDELKVLMGRVLAQSNVEKIGIDSLAEVEFKVFSQFGDDGIIQYLVHNLELKNKTFIEFGVEDYFESNTRFLLQKDNWSGFVMDGSSEKIARLKSAPFYWKHDLNAQTAFVTRENINELLYSNVSEWAGVDLLHIDIDGNDYWIWKEIKIDPAIVIMEYNSSFGCDRALTVPYEPDFYRTTAHYSNLYWGCSLKALYLLAADKGYEFIGCNSAGNNAYFVKKAILNEKVRPVTLEKGYVPSKYRESRDKFGNLTFAPLHERKEILRGLPAYDVELETVVPI